LWSGTAEPFGQISNRHGKVSTRRTETLEQVRTAFDIAIPVALILASFGGFLLAKRSLAPVAEMGEQAARISSMNLHERLPVKSERDEVGRLAIIINDLCHD